MACAYARLVGGVLVGRSLAVRWRRQQSLQGGLTPRLLQSLHASSRLWQLYFRGRILVLCKISVSLFWYPSVCTWSPLSRDRGFIFNMF